MAVKNDANSAYDGLAAPETDDLQYAAKTANTTTFDPTSADAAAQSGDAFQGVSTSPLLRSAQMSALDQLQGTATNGGLNATDKAQLAQIGQQQAAQNKGQQDAILQQAAQRGGLNSGATLAAQLSAQQGAATAGSNAGMQVAGNAQSRALDAMTRAGALGQSMEGQQFGEDAAKAQAANQIAQFNAANRQQTALSNANAANQAAAANAAAQNAMAQFNAGSLNQASQFNNQMTLQDFIAKLQEAQGRAGTSLGQQQQDMSWLNTLMAGIGGVAGAAGKIIGHSDGGVIEGQPHVPGDSPANDTVPAMLSPGEIVLPRSVVDSPSRIIQFLEQATGKSFGGVVKGKK